MMRRRLGANKMQRKPAVGKKRLAGSKRRRRRKRRLGGKPLPEKSRNVGETPRNHCAESRNSQGKKLNERSVGSNRKDSVQRSRRGWRPRRSTRRK
jgi:hypothetical protein